MVGTQLFIILDPPLTWVIYIAPKYRPSLGANQLFAVLKTRILEKYCCEQVLECFMLQLTQVWYLARLLPLMIGDKVTEGDEKNF